MAGAGMGRVLHYIQMQVLFICKQNVGRSQMAKAFYNAMTQSNNAGAAGTAVDEPGQTLRERKGASHSKNFFVLDAMEEKGIDMSAYTRAALEVTMLDQYDAVVSMAKREDTPAWLLRSPKYIHWDVTDPRGQDLQRTREVRDEIEAKVTELIARGR